MYVPYAIPGILARYMNWQDDLADLPFDDHYQWEATSYLSRTYLRAQMRLAQGIL